MSDKKIILLIGFLLIAAGTLGLFLIERDGVLKSNSANVEVSESAPETKTVKPNKKTENQPKKIDLYSDFPYYIPLSSIVETADFSSSTKEKVNRILEISQGCYFIKQNPAKKDVYIFLQNPATDMSERYMRHNLQVAHIDEHGNVSYSDIGYSGEYGEIANAVVSNNNDEWIFDETVEPKRPIKHVAFDDKKKILYSESWNYDEKEPIKYEMKNANGAVISVMKETFSGDSGYRQEHIFYDDSGNIIKSLTANYDGADIIWFTYYDSDFEDTSITIESVYNSGVKIAEKVYNHSYQLIKQITPSYTDGILTSVKILNPEGAETDSFWGK